MATVVRLFDNLRNALTGMGTGRDARAGSAYAPRPFMSRDQIDAAYRGSGMMRKIITIPALDMVREWRDWKLESEQISAVEAVERRLAIPQKVYQAEVLRGLGGAALILGLPGDPATPPPEGARGGLSFVHVVSRWHLHFQAIQQDATQPGYGEPEMWLMSDATGRQVPIHPSRVIPFRADTSATMLISSPGMAEAFWGESVVTQVLDAVQDNDTARASFAALMHKARVLRIGIPGLMDIVASPGGEKLLQDRMAIMAMAESIHNATIFDAGDMDGKGGETIEDAAYSFAGAKDVLTNYAEFVAAISDIPASRLLGSAPEGLNSSGDSQQRDWQKKIRARQTLELSPCIDRLDRHLIPSVIGIVPDGFWYEWSPLDNPGEKEVAERFKVQMEAVEKLAQLAAIPDRAFNRGVQSLMVNEGYLPGLEAALAEIPEDERFGIEQGGGDPNLAAGPDDVDPVGANDASPRPLYVSRPLLNRAELQRWAAGQGLGELQPDLHVTIAASRMPLDWMKIDGEWNEEKDGTIEIPPGGVRIIEPLGNRTAVLLFTSSRLSWRHEQIRGAGASWDFDDYQPHISLTGEPVELGDVDPYRGRLVLGPERFEEFDG